MWLTKLQIAIIEKNPEAIDTLMKQMPKFESVDDMKSASALIQEALKLLYHLKNETSITLKKLKKHRNFLNATAENRKNKFDIIS
ncbi:hypothetical protein [Sulfurimonas sp.]